MTHAAIISLIIAYSQVFGLDPKLTLAVARVESNYNTKASGELAEVGLFQIRPELYPMFSKSDLQNPYTNTMIGLQMISTAKRDCPHQKGITFLICFNYGISNAKKVKHPELFPYIIKIKKAMKQIHDNSCYKTM